MPCVRYTARRPDWLDVTTYGDAQTRVIPGQVRCPEDPRHATAAARGELDWPEALKDDDRAWLRRMRDIA